jgi:phosphoglycolate phosphatase-like HAD superfamily hydrolase
MNPLFPGVGEKLQTLGTHSLWYIVTTKQERFVTQILKANQIELPGPRIFGLDRKMSKEEVLIDLKKNHPDEIIYFVEDRLPTLLNVLNNDKLQDVRLFFATWGYNTVRDKQEAEHHPIECVNIEGFLE